MGLHNFSRSPLCGYYPQRIGFGLQASPSERFHQLLRHLLTVLDPHTSPQRPGPSCIRACRARGAGGPAKFLFILENTNPDRSIRRIQNFFCNMHRANFTYMQPTNQTTRAREEPGPNTLRIIRAQGRRKIRINVFDR